MRALVRCRAMSACHLSRSAVDLEGTWELVEGWMQARLGGSVVTGGGGSLVTGGGGCTQGWLLNSDWVLVSRARSFLYSARGRQRKHPLELMSSAPSSHRLC